LSQSEAAVSAAHSARSTSAGETVDVDAFKALVRWAVALNVGKKKR